FKSTSIGFALGIGVTVGFVSEDEYGELAFEEFSKDIKEDGNIFVQQKVPFVEQNLTGQMKEARKFFLEMKRRKCEMDVVTYKTVMDKAIEYLDRMKHDECEPNVQTYNVIVRYYCDEDEIEKSLNVFKRMGTGECLPNLDLYNILINGMFGRKRFDDLVMARKLLIEMIYIEEGIFEVKSIAGDTQ
ncbi:pentatricopeptide repeat-containing protein, partial [Tanacetum coccineum]